MQQVGVVATGDGSKYEPAGIVHKGEYVVPQWMLHQPPAINYVRALEAIRQNRQPPSERDSYYQNSRGYAEGGLVEENAPVVVDNSALQSTLVHLTKAIERLEANHIKAYVVLTELEAKQKELNSVKTSK